MISLTCGLLKNLLERDQTCGCQRQRVRGRRLEDGGGSYKLQLQDKHQGRTVHPVATPNAAVCCTRELLREGI